ncbi:hypothetical protein [Sphingomonas sp. PB1R3]|uniref:hypothetical protein n=1 Tax=Sphingomonas flavida TaxID=3096154 RepID=UPI003FA74639
MFLATAPLAVFGGPALQQFAITLLFGLLLATSSSIFIAAPLLLTFSEQRDKWAKRSNANNTSALTQA